MYRPPEYHVHLSEDGGVRVASGTGEVQRQDGYQIGGLVFDGFFSSSLAPQLADLVEVGVAVYAADRMCRRRLGQRESYEHTWHRHMRLTIPVRNPALWSSAPVLKALQEALIFLTEDDWDFSFVARGGPSRTAQGSLFTVVRREEPTTVALFSGGLDSLAGLCQGLEEDDGSQFVLVSAWTNGRLYRRQSILVDAVSAHTRGTIVPVFVPFSLRRGSSTYNDDETSQRTRGFVHGLLGAAVSLSVGQRHLACYENGVGALNLPLSSVQLGVESARSAHPVAFENLARLVEAVTDARFEFRLPFLFATKGELCQAIRRLGLSHLVTHTVSCDGFPRRVRGEAQCGTCTSCLLRRQALKVAGLERTDPGKDYAEDLHAAGQRAEALEWGLGVMLQQVRCLRGALASPDPWGGLIRTYPDLDRTVRALGAAGHDEASLRARLLGLYTRYCAEWEHFQQQSLPIVA